MYTGRIEIANNDCIQLCYLCSYVHVRISNTVLVISCIMGYTTLFGGSVLRMRSVSTADIT